MDYETVLRSSDYDSKVDLVGLTVFYLDHEEDAERITSYKINSRIKESRATISRGYVKECLDKLKREDLVKNKGKNYILTYDGLDHYKEMVGAADTRNGKFIEIDDIRGDFFQSLVDDINKTYRIEVFDGTLILTRKLLENLLIDIFREKYGEEKIELYFNPSKSQHEQFSTLIDNFDDRINSKDKDDFSRYSGALNQSFIDDIKQFKAKGDATTHSIEVDIKESKIGEYSELANSLVRILADVREKVYRE